MRNKLMFLVLVCEISLICKHFLIKNTILQVLVLNLE